MPDESTTPAPTRRIPRRTLAKGAAWAVPVVATVAAAPAYAAKSGETLPPCLSKISNDSVNWIVDDAIYTGCTKYCDHRDVRLTFHIAACDKPVTIRVSNVQGNSQWCAWSGGIGTLTKTVAANTAGTLTFPNTGDTIVGNGGCKITAYPSVNDGMHINPCTDGPYFMYEVFYSPTATGTPDHTGYWGDANNPPKANLALTNSVVPTGLTLTRSGTTISASWNAVTGATEYEVQIRRKTSGTACSGTGTGNWGNWSTVSTVTSTSWSNTDSTNTRCVEVRVLPKNECSKGDYATKQLAGSASRMAEGSSEPLVPQDSGAESSTPPPAAPAPAAPAPSLEAPAADVPATPAPAADAPAEG